MNTKQELIKALRSNKKLYAYISHNDDSGGYVQIVKSDYLEAIKEMDNATLFNCSIDEKSIYIG